MSDVDAKALELVKQIIQILGEHREELQSQLARAAKVVEAARELSRACYDGCNPIAKLNSALAEYDKLAKGESETLLY